MSSHAWEVCRDFLFLSVAIVLALLVYAVDENCRRVEAQLNQNQAELVAVRKILAGDKKIDHFIRQLRELDTPVHGKVP